MLPELSQSSLQDYVDCQRRFQLRYVERVNWPGVRVEPALDNERFMQQGAAFHRLIHKHEIGLPDAAIEKMLSDDDLRRWWQNFRTFPPANIPDSRRPEVTLSVPIAGETLLAKYDLVAVEVGKRVVIVDWKTSRKRPKRQWMEQHLQTRVYRYVMARAGSHFNDGQAFAPEQIEMVYWFADHPQDVERFAYSAEQFSTDEAYLTRLVKEIQAMDAEADVGTVWPLTEDFRQCTYCAYRSLCQRGERAGNLADLDTLADADTEIDVFAEIEF